MGPTEYCTMILLPEPSQNLPCVSLLEPGILDCRLLWVSYDDRFMNSSNVKVITSTTGEAAVLVLLMG
jgi:hypothetical protein